MIRRVVRNLLGCAAASMLVACGGNGSASVTSSIPGAHLELHTVYGWVLGTTATHTGSALVYSNASPKGLKIIMSGASFDPTQDINFIPVTTREQWVQDERLNGRVELDFADLSKATVNTPIKVNYDDSNQTFVPLIAFGETKATNSTTFPNAQPGIGSQGSATLTLNSLGSNVGDSFGGKLEYIAQKGNGDPDGVATGTLTIDFSGSLVSQALGACEIDLRGTYGDCNPNDP